jgi:hypothetical protein
MMHNPNATEVHAVSAKPSNIHKTKLVDFNDGRGLVRTLIPRTYAEAHSPEFVELFASAAKSEVDSYVKMEVYGPPLDDLPAGQIALKSKWIFDIKTKAGHRFDKTKARLTSKGYAQQYLKHYQQTYGPTAQHESVRLIIFLCVVCGYTSYSFDVKVAFLNDPADTKMFSLIPEGIPGYEKGKKKYSEQLKNIYGNKQAARIFWLHFDPRLRSAGYQPIRSDPCVYWKRDIGNNLIIIVIHVDNGTVAAECLSKTERQLLESILQDFYDITTDEIVDIILGMSIHRNFNGEAIIYGDGYFDEIVENLNLQHLTPSKSMGDTKARFQPNTSGKSTAELVLFYQCLIGSLLYAARMWRPDICNAIRHLGSYTANPSFEHVDAAILILRYCLGTKRYGLRYARPGGKDAPIPVPLKLQVVGWSDADWNKEFDRKSVSGTCLSIRFPSEIPQALATGGASLDANFINYRSKKQADQVATSTESSEAVAAVVEVLDAKWLSGALQELDLLLNGSKNILFIDNKDLLINLNEYKIPTALRHEALKFAIIFEEVEQGRLQPWFTPSEDNVADLQTKNLSNVLRMKHANKMMGNVEE